MSSCKNPHSSSTCTSSSITFDELKMLADARDAFVRMNNNPVNKDHAAKSLQQVRKQFDKSIALQRNMKKGSLIKNSDIVFKKPGSGIPPSKVNEIAGMRLKRDVSSAKLLKWDDIQDVT